jgi:hypothetical protein
MDWQNVMIVGQKIVEAVVPRLGPGKTVAKKATKKRTKTSIAALDPRFKDPLYSAVTDEVFTAYASNV